MNIYVGNLPYKLTEDQLRLVFEEIGRVTSCTISKDKETGLSRGIGFVEMPDNNEALRAITMLNGKDFQGRPIEVRESVRNPDRQDRPDQPDRRKRND